MKKNHLVVTLLGPDKRGLITNITDSVLEYHASIEESRMTRLGGEFTLIMLLSIAKDKQEACCKNLQSFKSEGLEVFSKETNLSYRENIQGYIPYEVAVWGADHEGIVHAIAEYMLDEKIIVGEMETHVTKAPISGAPLFSMTALVQAPPKLSFPELREELEDLGDELGVDIDVKLHMD